MLGLSTEEFFQYYTERKTYEEIPLLTSDDIVIPKIGLEEALYKNDLVYSVPTIAGSNRDEVKLWLSTAEYFVELDFSALGSVLNIPKVKLKMKMLLKPLIITEVQLGKSGVLIFH